MIFVGGLSGAGKTTFVKKLVASHDKFEHVQASAVLKQLGLPVDGLTLTSAAANQTALLEWLHNHRLCHSRTAIVDGHGTMVVEEGLYEVPTTFFCRLPFESIFVVEADPIDLLSRRVWPKPYRSAQAISRLQERELWHLADIADALKKPLIRLRANDTLEEN